MTDAKLKEAYEAVPGRQAKADFRAAWAKGAYEKFAETKRFEHARVIEEATEGTMLSLERIVVEEGGGKAGVRAAVNYAISCLKEEQPGWVRFDNRTQALKFRYIVDKVSDRTKRTWSTTQDWSLTRTGATTAGSADFDTKTDDQKRLKKDPQQKEPVSATKKHPTKLADLPAAKKTKQLYTSTMGQVPRVIPKMCQHLTQYGGPRVGEGKHDPPPMLTMHV